MLVFTSVLAYLLSIANVYSEQLVVSVIAGEASRNKFFELGEEFETQTGIEVIWNVQHDSKYKDGLEWWFQGNDTPDVMLWQAGERLVQYVRKDWVIPVTDLWERNNYDDAFPENIKEIVSYEEDVYAIPSIYYPWAFYYRKSVFQKLGLTPPTDWEGLIQMCDVMKANGLVPFVIGTRYLWPSAAWFDYLNLRINGLDFHMDLTSGAVPYTDIRVRDVFEHWKFLIDRGCFMDAAEQSSMKWDEPLPLLYRERAGTGMFGGFVSKVISQAFLNDFDFFPFPTINDVPRAEEAPTVVFLIPKKTKNKSGAERFLEYVGGKEFQEKFNNTMGTLSPNMNASEGEDRFAKKALEMLRTADGVSQFFDRDTPKAMSGPALKIFVDFLANADVDLAITKLEAARKVAYQTDPATSVR